MTSITWDDEAQDEFANSALRYAEVGGASLAGRFVSEVETAILLVRSNPRLFREFSGEARKVLVEHFPYAVIYWHEPHADNVHIVAIMHLHREPGYWQERL
jgi:plasmid stabilization system protein ParE